MPIINDRLLNISAKLSFYRSQASKNRSQLLKTILFAFVGVLHQRNISKYLLLVKKTNNGEIPNNSTIATPIIIKLVFFLLLLVTTVFTRYVLSYSINHPLRLAH